MGSLVLGESLYSVKQDDLTVITSPHKCVSRHLSLLNGMNKTIERVEMPSQGWACTFFKGQKLCDR